MFESRRIDSVYKPYNVVAFSGLCNEYFSSVLQGCLFSPSHRGPRVYWRGLHCQCCTSGLLCPHRQKLCHCELWPFIGKPILCHCELWPFIGKPILCHCELWPFIGKPILCTRVSISWLILPSFILADRLIGIVVLVSSLRADDPGFDSCLHPVDFTRSSHTKQWFKRRMIEQTDSNGEW